MLKKYLTLLNKIRRMSTRKRSLLSIVTPDSNKLTKRVEDDHTNANRKELADLYLFKDHPDFPPYDISVNILEYVRHLELLYLNNPKFSWYSAPFRSVSINAIVSEICFKNMILNHC